MSSQIGGVSLEQARAQLTPWTQRAAPIAADEYQQRIERARRLMRAHGVDALLIGAGTSLRYFTGVPWGASERLVALLLTLDGDPVLICPAFEKGSLDAVLKIPVAKYLWEEHEDPYALVVQAMDERHAHALALDPGIAFAVHTGLRAHLGTAIRDAGSIIDGCRMCKSPAELALMQQACDMTLLVQRLAAGIAQEGIGTDQLVRFIDEAHRALGADNGSTFCIVQFGHATSFPHGIPGVQHLREGELVLIDTGCTVQGYHSDITRTWSYGTPNAAQQRIWDLEQAAQAAAFAAIRPGVACEAVDQAARKVLEAAGLGPDYRLPGLPHRTGHGCGLAIHEAPYLVRGNAQPLQPGMCASNEPMIVVPGEFGVRLEDHFYVTDAGAQWFTPPSLAIDQPFA
ncbi:M24 family metallopeptidase [Xanthomonas hortorum pv. vitians]|uniref:Peptidase n=1 Tax=Xanthomonas hortorum pv. vitians TaxID=83224 RepID=A0A6V7DT35_9XANT|nr:Xaa-Pro peptidase family protein [Xanthomonas hortorum]APP84468.1 X-Pro dipeptidase [Xanthomonas hortorum pv. gardneri]ASW45677.1 X-Pro dipeptidase [Xanthomonas hortorum]MCC8495844.1 Xaa-Pro peptidase family protein [Xanthomonas hortorum pv. gardneri]MCE4299654.1 Xaa-Pro peptidase family protein [Xanthomonas hortorum pv. vitians]MCE4304502.1 Xaa-Pro peptidase family protein [Xanthomonas hortorum pv. vitians]